MPHRQRPPHHQDGAAPRPPAPVLAARVQTARMCASPLLWQLCCFHPHLRKIDKAKRAQPCDAPRRRGAQGGRIRKRLLCTFKSARSHRGFGVISPPSLLRSPSAPLLHTKGHGAHLPESASPACCALRPGSQHAPPLLLLLTKAGQSQSTRAVRPRREPGRRRRRGAWGTLGGAGGGAGRAGGTRACPAGTWRGAAAAAAASAMRAGVLLRSRLRLGL